MAFFTRLEVRLTADWKDVVKRSSFWLTWLMATFWLLVPEISSNWTSMAPFLLKYFPASTQEALGPFIGAVLIILAKLSYIRIHAKDPK